MAKKKTTSNIVQSMYCKCNLVFAILIIILIWAWPNLLWSKLLVTLLAIIIGFSKSTCALHVMKGK